MTQRYDFNERLTMSQGVSATAEISDILIAEIPGALSVHSAHKVNDRNGTDYWVEHCTGRHLSVDCKVREVDFANPNRSRPEDDLALETWSVVEESVVGWTRNESKRCDYVLWFWKDTRRWCLLPFAMLCAVFKDNWQKWCAAYRHPRQATPWKNGTTYHSECVFVPRREVWAAIYTRFSGNPKPKPPKYATTDQEPEPDRSQFQQPEMF